MNFENKSFIRYVLTPLCNFFIRTNYFDWELSVRLEKRHKGNDLTRFLSSNLQVVRGPAVRLIFYLGD